MNEDEIVFYLNLTGLFLGKPSRCKHDRGDDREKNQPISSSLGFHASVVNPAKSIFKDKITVLAGKTAADLVRSHARLPHCQDSRATFAPTTGSSRAG